MRATLILSLLLAGCPKKTPEPAVTEPAQTLPADPAARRAQVEAAVSAALDKNTSPCDDFYRYACGGWIDTTTIPADKTRFSRSFTVISDRNEANLRAILEETAKNPGDDPESQLVGAFYGACMDEDAIEQAGAKPLDEGFAIIESLRGPADVMTIQAKLGLMGVDPLWGTFVDQDAKNPELMLLQLAQGGLSLPDREYYLTDDPKMMAIRDAWEAHVARMFSIAAGDGSNGKNDAKFVAYVEKRLAEASIPRHELHDPDKTYHRLDRQGLRELTPKLPWDVWFIGSGRPDLEGINVLTPEYFKTVEELAEKRPRELKAYFRWQLLHAKATHLSKAFVDENFAFYGKELSGQQEQRERWKRCAGFTDTALGHPLAKQFVARHFSGDSKPIAEQMVQDLEHAFVAGLPELEWMDDTTRERAEDKAASITNKIGFPDKWREFSGVQVGSDHFANHLATAKFNIDFYLDQVGKAPDPEHWYMTPPTVNAYYNPGQNEIVFPAGILQDPFFDKDFPAAMNYGAIGMVIGHEITHGFDDDGRKFDKTGKLEEWWEPEVAARFEERAACVEKQYDTFEVQPELFINGKLTLGENIADLGGVKQAVRAYKAWEERNGAQTEFAGHTPEQLVYLAYAQGWCTIMTEEQEAMRVRTDSHSPAKFRVNGALRNLPEFGEAFQCEAGSYMRPTDLCEVW